MASNTCLALERRQRQAASLEVKHTRLSMELSTALEKLQDAEQEAGPYTPFPFPLCVHC